MPIRIEITADTAEEARRDVVSLAGMFMQGATVQTLIAEGGVGSADASAVGVPQSGAATATGGRGGARGKTAKEAAADVKADGGTKEADAPKTETQGGAEVPALTYEDDVKPAVLRLAMSKGREGPNGVMAVLTEFGAKEKATEIAAEKWPALLDRIEAAIAAEA